MGNHHTSGAQCGRVYSFIVDMLRKHIRYSAVAIAIGIIAIVLWPQKHAEAPETQQREAPVEQHTLTIASTTLAIEIADTPKARTQGLSGRESLPKGTGLLFIYEKNGRHGIWMKDMRFAIDILWFDEARRLIHVEEEVEPETFPDVFRPLAPARYVLELPAGTVAEQRIELGAIFDL